MTSVRLAKDLARLLESQLSHDVVVRVGQGDNAKEFPAHAGLLRARSPYFDVALSSRWVQPDQGKPLTFEKPDVSPATFEIILRYMYTGQVDWEHVDKDPLATVVAADELLLDELLDLVQDHLVEKRSQWLAENNAEVLNVVVDRDTCAKLRDHSFAIISADATALFKSKTFIHLRALILKSLIKRDDLAVSEFEIWQNLVRWAIANTDREVSQNCSDWSREDREAIRVVLEEFIPHVRFYDISGPDFLDGVLPLKLLPKNLKWDLIKFHIDPGRKPHSVLPPRQPAEPAINSVLLHSDQAKLLQAWIANGKTSQKPKWKLLYRASRDGYDQNTFHNRCDNNGPTITIAKCKDRAGLVGGYTPLSWSYGTAGTAAWKKDTQHRSFVFSLGTENVLSRINHSSPYAIYDGAQGPVFGNNSGYDLYITNNCNSNENSRCIQGGYEIPIPDQGWFSVVDYEVYEM